MPSLPSEQFLITVADVCAQASLARIELEVMTSDGHWVRGVPYIAHRATPADNAADDVLLIDDIAITVSNIRGLLLLAPDETPHPAADTPDP